VILACAAWKDKVNLEDLLFAGALIHRLKNKFYIDCDSSQISETLYLEARNDYYQFLKEKKASHFQRLYGYGLEKDIRYCLTPDVANVLPIYEDGKLIVHNG
jgi:2-phosphosulfolactate phosphatase